MECPQCKFDNPPGMKFCGACGTRLPAACGRCGTVAVPGFKFCGECGAPLDTPAPAPSPTPPPAPAEEPPAPYEPPFLAAADDDADDAPRESEIKQVTVLRCELSWPPSREGLDTELLHALLNRFLELARAEVQRYGGTINQVLNQGFMALFGAPVAYEDHAHRAVLAARGLRDRMAAAGDEVADVYGIRWGLRAGIATGPVVVGGFGDMAVGPTTTVAARLRSAAEPGDLLVNADTRRLVEGEVELTAHEPVGGEGGEGGEEIPAWRVGAAIDSSARASPRHGRQSSPFVGRAREIGVLEELRDQAAAGQGQVVGIAGEAGAGKSRLLYEFRRSLRDANVSYLRGHCASYGSGIPYLPLIDMIRSASRISATDDPATVTAKLRGNLEQIGVDAADALPYLLRLLGIQEGTESLEEVEPQAFQSRTFATLRRILLAAAQQSPVIMEIEDVHWIDATSEDFLGSLVEVMAAARLLLVLTYRAGFKPRWLEKSYASQLTLRPLSPRDSETLMSAVLEEADLEAELAREILAKAEGNPFFLEELARAIATRDTAADEAIPNTIQGVLMARIDRLPAVEKRLIQTASALGREFSLELLEAIWDRPEPLEPLLRSLQQGELLYKAPSEDRQAHFFKHALTQEVTYRSLLSNRRRELHRRAAEALEELYADRLEDAFDLLIFHYPKAGEPEKTVHYLTRFATRAARNYSHAEAATALREALAHAEQLPEESRDRRLLEVLLQLAESLLPLARFPETLEICERFAENAERLADPSLSAQYYFWLAHTHTYLGRQEETRRFAEQAIAAAQECGDESTEGKAHYVLGRDGFWAGHFSEGIRHSLRAVVLLERSGEPWWQGQAHWVAGFNHYVLGDFTRAIEALERARSIGEALDDHRLDTSWSLGYFHASLGDREEGIEQCRRGVERAQDPLNSAVALGFLGHAYLEAGEVDEAVAALEKSIESLRHSGMQQILGWFAVFLSEAYRLAGRPEEARARAEQALELTTEARFAYGEALASRALGRVAREAGDLAAARERLAEARRRFAALQVPFEVARTRLDEALLRHDQGDRGGAEEELGAARRAFEELAAPHFVQRTLDRAESLSIPLTAAS